MKTILVDITSSCNLRCKHCYNSRYFQFKNDEFDIQSFLGVLKEISYSDNINRIHLLGGEPLISSQIFEILDACSIYSKYISINTNGTLLNRNMIFSLKNYEKLDQITVSLDGPNKNINDEIRGEGVFERVINNLVENADILKSAFKVNIACVLTEYNFHNIKSFEMLNNFFEIDKFMFSFLYNQGNGTNIKSSIDVFDLLYEIGLLADCVGENKIMLDIPPLFMDWLNVLLGNDNKTHTNYLPNCGKDTFYYSAFNKTYICSPSSFYGSKYQITPMGKMYFTKRFCVEDCSHNEECTLCPINASHEGFEMCQQILEMIKTTYKDIAKLKIKESNEYTLICQNNNLIFINFKNYTKLTLIENYNKTVSYSIGELEEAISSRKKLLEFKSKVCALYYFGKINIG